MVHYHLCLEHDSQRRSERVPALLRRVNIQVGRPDPRVRTFTDIGPGRSTSASSTPAPTSSVTVTSSTTSRTSTSTSSTSPRATSSTSSGPAATSSAPAATSLDLALNATAGASSWSDSTSQTPDKAIDGVIDGYTAAGGDYTKEVRLPFAFLLRTLPDRVYRAVGDERTRHRGLVYPLLAYRYHGKPDRSVRPAESRRPGQFLPQSFAFCFR